MSDEYILTLSKTDKRLGLIQLFMTGLCFVYSLFLVFLWHHFEYLFWLACLVAIAILARRRVLRPFPSRLELTSTEFIVYDLPARWLRIGWLALPLRLIPSVTYKRQGLQLEWISGSLSVNDMISGESTFICHDGSPALLKAWLTSNGHSPLGG